MTLQITRDEARELFDNGYPISTAVLREREYGYFSAADHAYGARTLEDVEEWEERAMTFRFSRPESPRGQWLRAPASRRTLQEAAGHVMRRELFSIGNVSATKKAWVFGALLPEDREDLESDAVYVVYSYRTPIAWVRRNGDIIMPPVRYSNTTTQHQHKVARAFGIENFSASSGKFRKGRGKSPFGPGWQTRKWGGAA